MRSIATGFNKKLPRRLAHQKGCSNLMLYAVCVGPRASQQRLQPSSHISDNVTLSLFLRHTMLGDKLPQFSHTTGLKRPMLSQR